MASAIGSSLSEGGLPPEHEASKTHTLEGVLEGKETEPLVLDVPGRDVLGWRDRLYM